ncbi:MAG: 3-hydroxyacyl-CoA dehydrogenase NAD-binding domain-containing protein, partial [Kiloniellaceae bacterium]
MSDQSAAGSGSFEIKSIGIIGAGQMGGGIAHVCALAGYDVKLSDIGEERLEQALKTIGHNMDRQVAHNRISAEDKTAALGRISTGLGYELFRDCDLVIETATENEDVKRGIFKGLCPALKPEAIVCSNTSSISITRLAASTDRPGRFMGMHFMNPVPLMKLVELIRGIATEEETFQAVKRLALELGKTPATAEDFPAFIVNRILLPMIN